jgi:hypothetical protein
MTKYYNLIFLSEEESKNITHFFTYIDSLNYMIKEDQILYSIRNGDDFVIKNIENLKELNNIINDKILFTPDILKPGLYSLEDIKKELEIEKINIKYPDNIIDFFELLEDNYYNLSNLILLEYIYNKMIKNNFKIIHIIYE